MFISNGVKRTQGSIMSFKEPGGKKWEDRKGLHCTVNTSYQCQHPGCKLTVRRWVTDRGLLFTVGGVFSRNRRINRASSSAVIRWLTMATTSSTSTLWQSAWRSMKSVLRKQLSFIWACTRTPQTRTQNVITDLFATQTHWHIICFKYSAFSYWPCHVSFSQNMRGR